MFMHIVYGIVQAMHEGGSEMIWLHLGSYSLNKLLQDVTSCCKMSGLMLRTSVKCFTLHLAWDKLESVWLAF